MPFTKLRVVLEEIRQLQAGDKTAGLEVANGK